MRRMEVEFGGQVRFTYVMGGLAREFGNPLELVRAWLDAGERGGMPVDPRLWLDGPPASSYPACMAVKAAAEQGDPARYLRRLREGFACARRKLDTTEALVEEARAARLDVERFRIDLASHAAVEAFGADVDRAGEAAARDPGSEGERVRLPSIEFAGVDGGLRGVYGWQEPDAYRQAVIESGGEPAGETPDDVEGALRRFGSMSTTEVAVACSLSGPRAPATLWALAAEWRVRAEVRGSGVLWSAV